MAPNADPYRTLGLSRGASLDEVKRAYRRMVKANHPDAAGPGALARFLAIQAAYEQLAGGAVGSAGADTGWRGGQAPGRRPSAADADRADATRRAYGRAARGSRPGAGPGAGPGPAAGARPGARERRPGDDGRPRDDGPTGARRPSGPTDAPGGARSTAGRGRATLGSTSYDGADAGPFEPDWGGASWYGTTSGTYWTINPKEYADPRKHGPEYQARARRAAGTQGTAPHAGREAGAGTGGAPTHTTSSWWESTSGPAPTPEEAALGGDAAPGDAGAAGAAGHTAATGAAMDAGADAMDARTTRADVDAAVAGTTGSRRPTRTARGESAPDPARAAVDLGRLLIEPGSGGRRGRIVRAVLGWLPIALGLGWLVGELTGCGRFAATCDPSVTPMLVVGQGIVLAALLLLPEAAALATAAALVLLGAAVAAGLILSATGAAADEGSRRAALGALLVVAWLTGLAIAVVRRVRSGPRSAGPVS